MSADCAVMSRLKQFGRADRDDVRETILKEPHSTVFVTFL
jgi:hypothetical protein